MAAKSQDRALRKFGKSSLEFGSGTTNQAIQTRPIWIITYSPAQATAKRVMASAARLRLDRHFWRNRKRIAEIKVPACPIPTQNTNVPMGRPQPTVWFMPQMPSPVEMTYAVQSAPIKPTVPQTRNASHHQSGAGRSTSPQTRSLIEPKSWLPSTGGGGADVRVA